MNYEWQKKELGEIADIIDPHPSHRAPKLVQKGQESFSFAGIGDIDIYGNIDRNKARQISEQFVIQQEKSYYINSHTIGYGRVGTVGKVVKLRKQSYRYALSPTLAVINPKENSDPDFIFHLLNSKEFYDKVESRMTGTTRPAIGIQLLRKIVVDIPPLSIQKKVGYILSTLENKIELNKKINQTIESIAQTIFKSWFVDFDPVHAKANASSEDEYDAIAKELGISREILDLFPDEFEESELGLIPKDWKVEKIQNIISVKDGTHDSPKPKQTGFPLVTSKHIKNGVIDLATPNLISEEDFININKRSKVEKNDILIGMIGTVGDLYFVSNDEINFAIKNIGLFKTSEKELICEYIFCWLNTCKMRDHILTRLAGTTQKYISLTELRKIPLLLPPNPILFQFKEISKNLFELKKHKNIESQVISESRDSLLPKLLSGDIDLSNLTMEPVHD